MIVRSLTHSSDFIPVIISYRETVQPVLILGHTDKLTVYNTLKNDCNLVACEELGAYVISYVSNGGTAVSNVGDLGAYFRIKGKHFKWCKYVINKIQMWLVLHGVNAYIEHNDLLIYGKKVLGYTENDEGEYVSGSIFIAMTNSTDIVKKICLKPKTRQCSGLNEFGITQTEISEVIISATKEYIDLISSGKGDTGC